MENNRQEFKKRLKGLLGLVLIMGMMIQLFPMQVFAQTYQLGSSVSGVTYSLKKEDALNKDASGGSFILSGENVSEYISVTPHVTIPNGSQAYNYLKVLNNLPADKIIKATIGESTQDEAEGESTSGHKCRIVTLNLVPITFNVHYHNGNEFSYSDIDVPLNSPVKSPAELGINLGGWITYSWKTDAGVPVTNITGDSTLFLNTIDNTKAEGERIIGACWLLPGIRYVLGGTKSTDGYTYQLGTDVYVSGNPDSDPQTYVVTN